MCFLHINFHGGIMIQYKLDILQALKEKGFTSYKLRNDKLLNESTMTKLRNKDTSITLQTLDTICKLLSCQPSDIINYTDIDKPEEK